MQQLAFQISYVRKSNSTNIQYTFPLLNTGKFRNKLAPSIGFAFGERYHLVCPLIPLYPNKIKAATFKCDNICRKSLSVNRNMHTKSCRPNRCIVFYIYFFHKMQLDSLYEAKLSILEHDVIQLANFSISSIFRKFNRWKQFEKIARDLLNKVYEV